MAFHMCPQTSIVTPNKQKRNSLHRLSLSLSRHSPIHPFSSIAGMAKTHAAAAAVLAAVLLATVCSASAQMPAAAPGPAVDECLNNLLNVSDCLTYVEAGSNLTAPEKPCCGELASLVDNHPICLCDLLSKGSSYGFNIDVNRALKLPSVCNVVTPPLSTCAAVGIPVGAPMASEGPSGMTPGSLPPSAIAASPTPGNTGGRASWSTLLLVTSVGAAILPVFF
ncbi:non-specific lipid transfer protein GPI-anchored 12-like isoform X1 [Rhodamnia argentea]|uniref:Non-specific lipid transfer protein GPI-anchored 12-like isoform X1 n=1 Tax=Rhodamnia argentea TaxID=178133 RepID=A0A8B8NGM7_9MYRT|nr:non-specific lipid transfer protein GPI-anchored 12-like isoform X1 [Rhodamnia argentea]